jgi:hypothetical protein
MDERSSVSRYAERRPTFSGNQRVIPISFEFFPPKTDEQRETLEKALPKLKARAPEYVSVTFGAGGSTLSYTPETIRHLRETHALEAAPHVSCMGGSREEIRSLLKHYREMGCTRLVALRGDMPSGMATLGEIRHASDLVTFVRDETGDHFHIEVACYPEVHPQSDDSHADIKHFKAKVDAGANGAITQYFYNADAYFHFVDAVRKAGIDVPISAERRFRAGSPSGLPRSATMSNQSANSLPTSSAICATGSSKAARRACTSTRSIARRRRSRSSSACAEAGAVQLAPTTLRRCAPSSSVSPSSSSLRCPASRRQRTDKRCIAASVSTARLCSRVSPAAVRKLEVRKSTLIRALRRHR